MVPDFVTAGFSDFFSGVTEVNEVATEAVDLIRQNYFMLRLRI